MHYDFNEHIERRGTHSLKHDMVGQIWGREDLIPMWVADMDFATPPFVIEAVKHRLDNRVLGYTVPYDEYFERVVAWNKHRYGFDVKKEEICQVPGVVAGINNALQAFTKAGENVMIMQPVYHPFRLVTEALGRKVVDCPLLFVDGRYEVDFNLMEKLAPSCKALILCNPHNPAGRVWTRDELLRMGNICLRHGVTVISDEIHCEFTYPGHDYTPYASLGDEFAAKAVVCVSPSKAFNIAGLQIANIVVPDGELRRRIDRAININEVCDVNPFGVIATIAAYNHGEEWLTELLQYLRGNYEYMKDFCAKNLPQFPIMELEGTYLAWMDCSALHLSSTEIEELLLKKAKLWLNAGSMYGREGEGYMRWNLACPRQTLTTALERFATVITH